MNYIANKTESSLAVLRNKAVESIHLINAVYNWAADYGGSFKSDDIPDLTGKNAIVTGGNTGIGYEICLALAKKNATVFMACRSKERYQIAAKKIENETGIAVHFIHLDLQDLRQVEKAADQFFARGLPLHILINNAGIAYCPFALSKDGIESQFATNHLGHFVFILLNLW